MAVCQAYLASAVPLLFLNCKGCAVVYEYNELNFLWHVRVDKPRVIE